jgi:transcriptional regulator with XRE-family HTH domain
LKTFFEFLKIWFFIMIQFVIIMLCNDDIMMMKGGVIVNENIGAKLKTLRKGRGLTQAELAYRMNWTRATISNYESNRRVPKLQQLTALCHFFGVSMDYWGIETENESFELLARARSILCNQAIPKEERERVYREIMKMYLEWSD